MTRFYCSKCWRRPCECKLDVFNPLASDQKTIAERQWQASSKAPAPQQAYDVGLFSDDSKQTELFTPATTGEDRA